MPAENKIRILIVIGQTGLGGAERQLYYLLKYSARDRFQYSLISLNPREPYTINEIVERLGVEVQQFKDDRKSIIKRFCSIYQIARRIKPQIIHSWSFYTNPYAGLAGKLAGAPVCLGSLRNEPNSGEIRNLNPIVRWAAYNLTNALIVNSRRAQKQLGELRKPLKRVFYVPNGIEIWDKNEEETDLSEFGITKNDRIVATVGNLHPRKNQAMFIRAMANLLPQYPHLKCLIIGRSLPQAPDLYDELQKIIDDYGLQSRIILTGARSDVRRLMRRFEIFALTSRTEGTPNVVLEAMEAGLPVVATKVGDVPDFIEDGREGFLIDSEDTKTFAEKVKLLLDNRELARNIGEAGSKKVKSEFSAARSAEQMQNLYLQLLKRN